MQAEAWPTLGAVGCSRSNSQKIMKQSLLARYGGREAALARGDLSHTPAPGHAPDIN